MSDAKALLLAALLVIVGAFAVRALYAAPVVAGLVCVNHCHPMRSRVVGDRCECLVGGAP